MLVWGGLRRWRQWVIRI
ncbi:hypothetical protein [Nitrospirillum sp. BR 11752]